MMDVEDMRSAAEERDRLADDKINRWTDREVRRLLDELHVSRCAGQSFAPLEESIKSIALATKTPYRGRYLEVKLHHDPITGKLVAEIVERK